MSAPDNRRFLLLHNDYQETVWPRKATRSQAGRLASRFASLLPLFSGLCRFIAGKKVDNLEIIRAELVCYHRFTGFNPDHVYCLDVLVIKFSPVLFVFQEAVAVSFKGADDCPCIGTASPFDSVLVLVNDTVG